MASSLPRPHTGRTARRLQNQNKLLQLLESNHHSVQNAALSAGISELQCGRQNEGIFDLFSAFPGLLPRFQEENSQVIMFKVATPSHCVRFTH
jgi:hypothetical protein